MAQAIRRWSVTTGYQVQTQVTACGFVADKLTLVQVFLRLLRFFPVRVTPAVLNIHVSFIFHRRYTISVFNCLLKKFSISATTLRVS